MKRIAGKPGRFKYRPSVFKTSCPIYGVQFNPLHPLKLSFLNLAGENIADFTR